MKTTYLGPWLSSKINYKDLVKSVNPISGTCIFIDICGSTAIKNKYKYPKWVTLIRNSISICQGLPSLEQPLKVIGDELMYFLPDEELNISSKSYADILNSVKESISSWKNSLDSYVLTMKGAIHYCADVYPISMIGERKTHDNGEIEIIPTKDFYGADIDLTARLMTEAESKKLIISDSFKTKVDGDDSSELIGILGPCKKKFKGFEEDVVYHYFKLE